MKNLFDLGNAEISVVGSQEILGKTVKVYGDFENPLFLAKDVAEWIDYARTGNGALDVSGFAASRHWVRRWGWWFFLSPSPLE